MPPGAVGQGRTCAVGGDLVGRTSKAFAMVGVADPVGSEVDGTARVRVRLGPREVIWSEIP